MPASAVAEPLTVERLDGLTDLCSLEGEWTALAERSDNVFATFEWLGTWWRHFGRGRELSVATVRDGDGRLRAVLPLYVASRAPVRVLRFLGHGPTDQLGPVCAVEDRALAARALARFATGPGGSRRGLLIADDVDVGPSDGEGELPGSRLLGRRSMMAADLSGRSGDDWLVSRSANLRDQLRRSERRLAAQGTVRFRTADDPDRLDQDLSCLLALHDLRWAAQGGSRAFTGRIDFHHDLARTALERGWLRLRFLELDGEAVAALYSFRFGGVESFYQAGRDPAYDRCSVGLLLHSHAIRSCADEGVREYRFLRGDEHYKRRLAEDETDLCSLAWAHGVAGAGALRALAHLPQLSRAQQRWVPAAYAWASGGSPRLGRP